mmetsp:Transcript_14759/g.15939  ORF Transcript_14759/g.15939 Transcript_14759/m.15939 type:complete len:91 (+) Transcript_14759:2058-2330(+)
MHFFSKSNDCTIVANDGDDSDDVDVDDDDCNIFCCSDDGLVKIVSSVPSFILLAAAIAEDNDIGAFEANDEDDVETFSNINSSIINSAES